MNDIIKIMKLLEDSIVLVDGITEIVKHEMEKTRRWISYHIFRTLAVSLVQVILRLQSILITSLNLITFFSRNNLSRMKDGAYVINLINKKCKRTHWVSLFIDRNCCLFYSFGTEYILQEVSEKIK